MSQPRTTRDRTAEQIRRIRRSRIRRERLASVSLGIALPVAAFFLELGLDKNVASYPYFVLSFIAILLATVTGGTLAGVIAAISSWLLNTVVLAERVPAEPIRPILDGINSGLAFVVGIALLEARKRPRRVDELTTAAARPPADERRVRILTGAIDDLAGSPPPPRSRTPSPGGSWRRPVSGGSRSSSGPGPTSRCRSGRPPERRRRAFRTSSRPPRTRA